MEEIPNNINEEEVRNGFLKLLSKGLKKIEVSKSSNSNMYYKEKKRNSLF